NSLCLLFTFFKFSFCILNSLFIVSNSDDFISIFLFNSVISELEELWEEIVNQYNQHGYEITVD
ncbi:hypothetical protein ACTPEM_24010, partial [Clostridioides difficile]